MNKEVTITIQVHDDKTGDKSSSFFSSNSFNIIDINIMIKVCYEIEL